MEAVTFPVSLFFYLFECLHRQKGNVIMLKTTKGNSKKSLYGLIDNLSEAETYTVKKFVEFLTMGKRKRDNKIIDVLLNVPEEDEEISKDELKGIKEALGDVRCGNIKSLKSYKKEHSL